MRPYSRNSSGRNQIAPRLYKSHRRLYNAGALLENNREDRLVIICALPGRRVNRHVDVNKHSRSCEAHARREHVGGVLSKAKLGETTRDVGVSERCYCCDR